ncbi:MAG: hypothetical protein R3247_09645, partial [Rhodothermales bacterium]|nr:hypothetical protein [Rhodothermales bacterium]
MCRPSRIRAGQGLAFVLLALLLLAAVPDATAQSRSREGRSSTKKERVDRKKRSTTRSTSRTTRERSSRRTETPNKTRRSTETPRTRTRSAPPKKQPTPQTGTSRRSRTETSRGRTQERSRTETSRGRTQERSRTETSRGRTGQSRSRTEQSRGRAEQPPSRSRSTTRQPARTQPSRGQDATPPTRRRSSTRSTDDANRRTGRSRATTPQRGASRDRSTTRGTNPERSRTRSATRNADPDRSRTPTRARSTERSRSGAVRDGNNRGRGDRRTVERERPAARTRTTARRDATRVSRGTPRRARHRDVGNRHVYHEDRGLRYLHRERWHDYFNYGGRYHRKKWRYHKRVVHHHHYVPVFRRPIIHVDVHWPWEHRYRHHWRPRYRYRQVVYVDAGWGRRQHRRSEIDVRTFYYHELRHATREYAEVDIFIERVELYADGRYLGEVDRIPDRLSRIRATVHRDGYVEFDRDVSIVGDPRAGFEMISTRAYDGYVLDRYRSGHDLRAGVLDLRRGRVVPTSYSRLFDPYDFNGFVPVSLLPHDAGWLLDYGEASFSGAYYDYDPYYYGGYQGYGDD